jgi:hypothetical protein
MQGINGVESRAGRRVNATQIMQPGWHSSGVGNPGDGNAQETLGKYYFPPIFEIGTFDIHWKNDEPDENLEHLFTRSMNIFSLPRVE